MQISKRMQIVNSMLVVLAAVQLLLARCAHGEYKPAIPIDIKAMTPQSSNGSFVTWVRTLPPDVGDKGLFWGVVPTSVMKTACDNYALGQVDYAATITGYSVVASPKLTMTNLLGCGGTSLQGVRGTCKDEKGATWAMLCPDNTTLLNTLGCAVYVTGPSVNTLYGVLTGNTTTGTRQLLQIDVFAECILKAAGPGAAAAVTSITACATLGPLAPLCFAGAAAVIGGGIAGACITQATCFPAHAVVSLRDGQRVRMDRLGLGQEVAVRRWDGALGYEPVLAWGHRDQQATARFVQIELASQPTAHAADAETTSPSARLELTSGHFVIIATARGPVHKRAADVVIGDIMWVAEPSSGAALSLWRVTSTSTVAATGLYNPYTTGGTIIVNDVAVSCHSEWFADGAFEALGLNPAMLPSIYQAALAPVRFLWAVFGRERYVRQYERLDAEYDITGMCSASQGGVLATLKVMASGGVRMLAELMGSGLSAISR